METPKLSLSKTGSRMQPRSFRFGESPETDWKIIFISAAFLSMIAIVVAAFIFIQIGNGEIFIVEREVSSGDTTLNIERLEEAVLYYQEKSAEFERLRTAPAPAVDPSL